MKIIGIILEANPFHLGHKYFISEVKKQHNPDVIIAITSTSFSMRGEVSLLNKTNKTKILLDEGIDLVLELPFSLAVQSADYFAFNAIKILHFFNITDLVFGSETDDLSLYNKCYNFINSNKSNFSKNKTLSQKNNFNLQLNQSSFSPEEIKLIEKPNFTLGLQYIKCIKDLNLNINYHLIERIKNNYHDLIPTNNIASATAIRNLHYNGVDTTKYITYSKELFPNLVLTHNNLKIILDYIYKINNGNNISDFMCKEGIQNYIKNNYNFNQDYISMLNNLKNKKYTISTISRSILHQTLNTKKNHYKFLPYLRILGINTNGLNYIRKLPKKTKNLIFSNPNEIKYNEDMKQINDLLKIELSSTNLYSIITNQPNLLLDEYKLPIRKE